MLTNILNYMGGTRIRRKKLPVLYQSEAGECGLVCVAMIAGYFGCLVDVRSLRRQFPITSGGIRFGDLAEIGSHLNLSFRVLRAEPVLLKNISGPVILHWKMNHFVVLKSVNSKGAYIHDPAIGEHFVSNDVLDRYFTGIVVELRPSDGFTPQLKVGHAKISEFLTISSIKWNVVSKIVLLSFFMEAFVLGPPLLLQMVLDNVIYDKADNLVASLALGFLGLILVGIMSDLARSHLLIALQNSIKMQVASRLIKKLVTLQVAFFERRQAGSIISNIDSLHAINNFFSRGALVSISDGVIALLTSGTVFLYSKRLFLIMILAAACNVMIWIALERQTRRVNEETLVKTAVERNHLFDTIIGMQTVRALNMEERREHWYQDHVSDLAKAERATRQLTETKRLCNRGIVGVDYAFSTFIGINLVINNIMTLGMLFAVFAFKRQFFDRVSALTEQLFELRSLRMHFERLNDILNETPDPTFQSEDKSRLARQEEITIELRGVCFSYSTFSEPILNDINLTINSGEFVSICGPSGGGKSTLIKLLLGLIEPTSGTVYINGQQLSDVGYRYFRDHVSSVLQRDRLFTGTFLQNITCFDPASNFGQAVECAQLVGLDKDIRATPSGYFTHLIDNGNLLSGGQRQRLLLARALYKRPQILILDEATSSLDNDLELDIGETLKRLRITRISVAHRTNTLALANRVLRLEGGALTELDNLPPKRDGNELVVYEEKTNHFSDYA